MTVVTRSLEDRALAEFATSGDPAAMARLFDAAAPKLLLIAAHWTSDPAEAEELVQLTFIHAVRDAASYDPGKRALPWLASILAHRALDRRRTAARRPRTIADSDTVASNQPTPLHTAIDRELIEKTSAAVDQLPEPYREVLVLRIAHGLEPAAIAHALGRPPATVRKQLERGLQRLRGLLPASLAGALAALLLPSHGLAAVRATILAEVGSKTPLLTSTALGGLLVNKLFGICMVAAAAMAMWLLWPDGSSPPPVGNTPTSSNPADPATGSLLAASESGNNRTALPAANEPSEVRTGSLRVTTLVEGTSLPAPGIGIELLPRDGRDEHVQKRLSGTDRTGTLRFLDLAPGEYRIRTLDGTEIDTQVQSDTEEQVTILVQPGPTMRGIVVDPNGDPIANASIWLYRSSGRRGRSRPHRAATTDGSGLFALHNVGSGIVVGARHDDHAESALLATYPRSPAQPLRLQLRPDPATLSVHVSMQDRPVVNALLELRRPSGVSRSTDHGREVEFGYRYGRTGKDGNCQLTGLWAGTATLVLRAPNAAPMARNLELLTSQTTEVVMALDPPGIVRGIVQNAEGTPIANMQVRCSFLATAATATTTSDGAFAFEDLPVGAVTIVVPGDECHCGRKQELQLLPGETNRCVIRLEKLPLFGGKVVDIAGRALANLAVTAVRCDLGRNTHRPMVDNRGRWDYRSNRVVHTAADGTFTVGVMPETDYWLDIVEPGQWLRIRGDRLGKVRAPRYDMVLTVLPDELATAHIEGRVRDSNGNAVEVALFQIGDGTRLATVGINAPGTRTSSEDGSFRIGPIPAREYVLTIIPANKALAELEVPSVRPLAGQTLSLGDIVMPVPAAISIAVRCTDGKPLHGVLAQFERGGKEVSVRAFDANGRLEHSLPPGNYTLTIYGEGIPSRKRKVVLVAGKTARIELEMPRALRFVLSLRLPEGETGGVVVIRGPDGTVDFDTEIEADDEFGDRWAPSLAPGPHTASLECKSGRRYATSFLVAEQQAAPGERPSPFQPHWQPVR